MLENGGPKGPPFSFQAPVLRTIGNEVNRAEANRKAAQLLEIDSHSAFSDGVQLVQSDFAETLLPVARELTYRFPSDAKFHQLLGLAARSSQESGLALDAFRSATAFAPDDPLIAHSLARTSLEAGVPAVSLFRRAARLAPNDGNVTLGLAAALLHEGAPAESIELLDQVTAERPEWIEAHRDAARLRGQMGLDPFQTIEKALQARPELGELWSLRISIALEISDLSKANEAVHSAQRVLGHDRKIDVLAAHILSESGSSEAADKMFLKLGPLISIQEASLRARQLIREQRPEDAANLIEPIIAKDREHALLPYLTLAWRMSGNPNWRWVEDRQNVVKTFDLRDDIADFPELVDTVRDLHFAKREPLDQSVKGGTQTDGNLLLRLEPPLVRLKELLREKVRSYADRLPPFEEGHPTLIARRQPIRFAGSWSVRLKNAGFHSDHVHNMGWISSAFYLTLPEELSEDRAGEHSGWLALGESRDLVPDLPPLQMIKPKIGRLVLFPSSMWHGTRPFVSGERMTVAFDIARPNQG
ncbi:MAG: hypothetical protein DI637_03350 [Citromicrobium sp.]|nr:MAG: hypothetical protein DI637_03350 [Citromicrobium sp.]